MFIIFQSDNTNNLQNITDLCAYDINKHNRHCYIQYGLLTVNKTMEKCILECPQLIFCQ